MQLAKPQRRQLGLMMALLTAPTVKQAADFIRENDYTIECSGVTLCVSRTARMGEISLGFHKCLPFMRAEFGLRSLRHHL